MVLFLVLSRGSYSLIEEDKIVKQLNVNTIVSKVLSSIEVNFDSAVVYSNKNVIKNENDYVATGDILVVYNGSVETKYTLSVFGDVNGDGKVNVDDVTTLSKHCLKLKILTNDEYLLAGDIDSSGKIDINDIIKVVRNISTQSSDKDKNLTIMLEDFDNIVDPNAVLLETDLSSAGIIYPEIHVVNNEVESSKGLYFDFRKNKEFGWAQIYNFSNNVANSFSMVTNDYYLRFWISNGENDNLYISLLFNDQNYVDANKVELVKYNGDKEEIVVDNKGGYGDDSSVKIPKGFKGWISFPLKYLKGNNNSIIELDEVKYLLIDVRPDTPKANTYYVIDSICLSTDTSGSTSNIKNEITYKTDLVGIFYTIWFDFWELANNSGGYNGNDYYFTGNVYNVTEGAFGPENTFHYWAKPALGYYTSTNVDVIEEHMKMLSDAGIDFVYIDFTNLLDKNLYGNDTYYEQVVWTYQVHKPFNTLLSTMKNMLDEGKDVPKIVPWFGTWQTFGVLDGGASSYVVERFYDEYYMCDDCSKYNDLWLYYDDKPLVMTTVDLNNDDTIIYDELPSFTYRNTWALFNDRNEEIGIGEWTWREKDNAIYGKNFNGEIEEMSVNVAVSSYYMSICDYISDSNCNDYVYSRKGGTTFYNQWSNVFNVHPKITLVGTWNEWGAQRLSSDAACGKNCFTDQYNQEYSNDIEPMYGGHGDQYYQWLISYINAYREYQECPRLVENGY